MGCLCYFTPGVSSPSGSAERGQRRDPSLELVRQRVWQLTTSLQYCLSISICFFQLPSRTTNRLRVTNFRLHDLEIKLGWFRLLQLGHVGKHFSCGYLELHGLTSTCAPHSLAMASRCQRSVVNTQFPQLNWRIQAARNGATIGIPRRM